MKELSDWVYGLDNIPYKEGRKRTLMDITGITHHETLWSCIYEFFLNTREEHGMDDLFLSALMSVTGMGTDFLENPTVRKEVVVADNKRIDLLLEDKHRRHAVIIENKVYHVLDNDLNLYYESVMNRYRYDDVRVVVLGLHKYDVRNYSRADKIPDRNKCSITHMQLMDRVMADYEGAGKQCDTPYTYLLKHFYQNIKNYTYMLDAEELNFFCDNDNDKIYRIARIYRHIETYIDDVMQCRNSKKMQAGIDKMGMTVRHERDFVKYIFNANHNVMFTVFFNKNILHPDGGVPHIHVVLEVQNKMKDKIQGNPDMYRQIISKYEGITYAGKEGARWLHLAKKTIVLENLRENLPDLENIIIKNCLDTDAPMVRLAKEIMKL